MSACNQCCKIPCECMDDRAELLRGEFPGWSVEWAHGRRDGVWMWRGDGPKPHRDLYAAVWEEGKFYPIGPNAPLGAAPDFLTAAEHATGETRLSRRAKVETGTARIVSWAEDIREQYEAAKAKHAAFGWSLDFVGPTAAVHARHEGMKTLVFTKVPDRMWRGTTVGIDVEGVTLEDTFVAMMDACRRGGDNRPRKATKTDAERDELCAKMRAFTADARAAFPRSLAPSAEALRAKGAAEVEERDEKRKNRAPDFHTIASALADTLTAKNAAYGNSFAVTGDFLRLLWPNGCKPEDFDRVMICARMFGPLCAAEAPDRAVRDALHAQGVASRLPDAKLAAAYHALRGEVETLRAQLRDVTAQRDEWREAADDYRALVANAYPADSFGKRKRALERLTKAIEAAR